MAGRYGVFFVGLPLAGTVSLLLSSPPAFPLVAVGWLFAVVAVESPWTAPTTGRHADVGQFQQTDLGHALTYRMGWVPSRVQPWVWPLLLMLLFSPGLAAGYLAVGGPPVDLPSGRLYAGSILLSPVAVLGGAFLIEGLLLQPLVAPFIAMFVLIALAATVGRDWAIFSRVFAGVVGVVWLLYAVDLARLLRRQRAA